MAGRPTRHLCPDGTVIVIDPQAVEAQQRQWLHAYRPAFCTPVPDVPAWAYAPVRKPGDWLLGITGY